MAQLNWMVLGLVAAAGAAGVAILGKIGLEGIDSTLATTLRAFVMAVFLLLLTMSTGRLRGLVDGSAGIDRRAALFIVLAGASGAISWLAYFAALRLGGAAQVAALDRLSLVLVLLMGTMILGERYGWRGWTGVALVTTGVLLIASDTPRKGEVAQMEDAEVIVKPE